MDYRRRFALAFLTSLIATGCGAGDGPDAAPRYVAVGAGGTIASSVDSMDWTAESSGSQVGLTSIAAGPSIVVAVGVDGTILTSPDGSAWTERASGTSADLRHVLFTGEKFVAVGGSWDSGAVTLTSRDGTAWTLVDSPSSHMFHAVAHGSGTLVAAAYYRSDLQTPALFASEFSAGSSISSSWAERQGPDFYDSVTTGDLIMVVGGSSVSTSRDGVIWDQQDLPGVELVSGVASSGSTFVIVGERGVIHRSADAAQWSEYAVSANWLSGVAHGDPGFVAVGSTGAIVSSPDGETWTTQDAGVTAHLADVAYGPTTPE